MGEKPTAATILSIIGGVFIVIGGLTIATVGSLISIFGSSGNFTVNNQTANPTQFGQSVATLGYIGVAMGIVTIIGGIMMYSKPTSAKTWGIIVLLLSLFSWITTLGGFFIGFLLALIGGILGITFKSSSTPTPNK